MPDIFNFMQSRYFCDGEVIVADYLISEYTLYIVNVTVQLRYDIGIK